MIAIYRLGDEFMSGYRLGFRTLCVFFGLGFFVSLASIQHSFAKDRIKTPVIAIIGDSNALGRGEFSQLSPIQQNAFRNATIFDYFSNYFHSLLAGTNSGNGYSSNIGAEVGLATALKRSGKSAEIVKLGIDASTFSLQSAGGNGLSWDQSELLGFFIQMTNNALTQSANSELSAIFVNLGVNDSTLGLTSTLRSGIDSFIQTLKQTYPNTPIYLTGLSDYLGSPVTGGALSIPSLALVQSELIRASNQYNQVHFIDIQNIPTKMNDSAHYSTSGLNRIGYRYYKTLHQLMGW